MTRPISMRIVVLTLFVLHCLFAIALVHFDDASVASILAGGRLSVSVGVIVAYSGVIARAGWRRGLSTGEMLAIGIVCAWISNAIFGAYTLAFQTGLASSNAALTAYATLFGNFSGAIHLACAAAIDGRVPLHGWLRGGIWAAIGMAAALTALALLAT